MTDDNDKEVVELAEAEEVQYFANNCEFFKRFLADINERGDGLSAESMNNVAELRGEMERFMHGGKNEVKFQPEQKCGMNGEFDKRVKNPKSKPNERKAFLDQDYKDLPRKKDKRHPKGKKYFDTDSESESNTEADSTTESEESERESSSSSEEDRGRDRRPRMNRGRRMDRNSRRDRSRRDRSMTEMMRNMDIRKLPQLEKYDEDSGRDLLKYLDKFELYCRENFRGNKDFWISELSCIHVSCILEVDSCGLWR